MVEFLSDGNAREGPMKREQKWSGRRGREIFKET
jgi:hypothetical protein